MTPSMNTPTRAPVRAHAHPIRWMLSLLPLMIGGSLPADASMDRAGKVFEVLEWRLENPVWSGNPFDLLATATFTHAETERAITTPMFYDGGDTWVFRFTAPRPGTWTLRTSGPNGVLDGLTGTVAVAADPEAWGFVTAHGSKFALQMGGERNLRAILYHVYMDEVSHRTNGVYGDGWIDWLPDVAGRMRTYSRAAREAGFDAATRTRTNTFHRFWRENWQLDLEPAEDLCCGANAAAMANAKRSRFVVYAENADLVRLVDLPAGDRPLAVTAVDAAADYRELTLEPVLGAACVEIRLPHVSDWALSLRRD